MTRAALLCYNIEKALTFCGTDLVCKGERGLKKVKIRPWAVILAGIFLLCIIINVLAWLSADFSDWYRDNIFLRTQPIFSAITGIFPFSVGEVMICIAVFGGIGMIISYIVLMIRKKGSRLKISAVYGKILAWVAAFLALALTMNFFTLYHCHSFAYRYGISQNRYTPQQLYDFTVDMIEMCNAASEQVLRDEDGIFVLTSDISESAAAAMIKLSDTYDTLSGYYPKPKKIFFSGFMTRLDIVGIYFPYSMEANYNRKTTDVSLPYTVCHEYAHLKGWLPEDEASFISYLACINSDDPEFAYSAYAHAVDTLCSRVYRECGLTNEEYNELILTIAEPVRRDLADYHGVFRQAQSGKVGSTMAKISDAAMETSLKINGVSDGTRSYGRFVDLLLNYYLGSDGHDASSEN